MRRKDRKIYIYRERERERKRERDKWIDVRVGAQGKKCIAMLAVHERLIVSPSSPWQSTEHSAVPAARTRAGTILTTGIESLRISTRVYPSPTGMHACMYVCMYVCTCVCVCVCVCLRKGDKDDFEND